MKTSILYIFLLFSYSVLGQTAAIENTETEIESTNNAYVFALVGDEAIRFLLTDNSTATFVKNEEPIMEFKIDMVEHFATKLNFEVYQYTITEGAEYKILKLIDLSNLNESERDNALGIPSAFAVALYPDSNEEETPDVYELELLQVPDEENEEAIDEAELLELLETLDNQLTTEDELYDYKISVITSISNSTSNYTTLLNLFTVAINEIEEPAKFRQAYRSSIEQASNSVSELQVAKLAVKQALKIATGVHLERWRLIDTKIEDALNFAEKVLEHFPSKTKLDTAPVNDMGNVMIIQNSIIQLIMASLGSTSDLLNSMEPDE